MRNCVQCGTPRDEGEFRSGRKNCRPCERANSREYGTNNRPNRNARLSRWRIMNPAAAKAKDRRARLKRHYNLTPDQATALLASNDGKCWICNDAPSVCIDHDHATEKVRGALCLSCNTFLGRIEANRGILDGLHCYLGQPCHADVLLEIANGR
jgi:hypothetical protein